MSKQSREDLFQQGEIDLFLNRDIKAFRSFKEAAKQDYPPAYLRLARMYATERVIWEAEKQSDQWQQKVKQNIGWFQTQAERGDPESQRLLAICYETGIGIEKDEKQAIALYRQAAEQKNARAQVCLGHCYLNGIGIEKDEKQAVLWFQKAAKQKDANGQFILGWCYEFGATKDEKQAVFWCKKAAEQGHVTAQYCLGGFFKNGTGVIKDDKQATVWYRKAAEEGDADAQYMLGVHLYKGLGVEEDQKQAFTWFQKAADHGHSSSQYFLAGECYNRKEKTEAIELYEKAAVGGHPHAQYILLEETRLYGGLGLPNNYKNILKVPKDEKQAFDWYQKAATQQQGKLNIGVAQYMLGRCYHKGLGVEPDRQQALYWLKKSIENGIDLAKKLADYISSYAELSSEADLLEWQRKAVTRGYATSSPDPTPSKAETSHKSSSAGMFGSQTKRKKSEEGTLCQSSCLIL